MRKHLFIVMLALLALFAGSAAAQEYYTLPEIREQAANGWHQTYTDKYGRTRQVDVDIDVFGENAAPVVKACWGMTSARWEGPSGEPQVPILEARVNGKGETICPYEDVPYMKVNLDEAYGAEYGNALTLREAYDFFDGLLQEQGKSFYQGLLWEQPSKFTVVYSADKKTGGVLIPSAYSISFCDELFGLPLLTHAGMSFEQLQVPFTCPGAHFNMKDHETYSGTYSDFDVAEVLADDIPLCSVETAIEGAREMIELGYIHDVTALRFGYVVYGDPELNWKKRLPCNEIDTWYLVPSWVMTCHILWNPKVDDPEQSAFLDVAINAQTGKMLDYFDTSLNKGGDVRFKGFISWDSVK